MPDDTALEYGGNAWAATQLGHWMQPVANSG